MTAKQWCKLKKEYYILLIVVMGLSAETAGASEPQGRGAWGHEMPVQAGQMTIDEYACDLDVACGHEMPGGTETMRGEERVMSLHECMEYAISNSTKMKIQEAETGNARLTRREALLDAFLPGISASTSASYSFGRNIDPETNTYINTKSFSNGYGLGASITLFNGFSAVNNLKISETSLKMGETRERQTEADICLAVMQAYYNVVYYKRLADICEEQVSTAETSLKKAQREEGLGLKGHADVVQMEADLADRQYDLINTRNMYEDQLLTLEDLMFWPMDEVLVIDTGMPGQAGHDVRLAGHDTIVAGHDGAPVTPGLTGSLSAGESFTDNIETDETVDFALRHDPAVLLADGARLNAKRELSTARWQLLPSVSLSGGWSTSYYNYSGAPVAPYMDMLKRNGGEYLSMSMSIPIFNRLSRRTNIARKRNALATAEAQYDQALRDVESEVRRAIQDRDGSARACTQAQCKAELQEEAYNLNLKKLEQGLISPLEFQTANNNYLRAKADEMNSLFQYLIKQAVVRYYNGEEYINQ